MSTVGVFSTVGENLPHGTHDISHMYHENLPHGTEHPMVLMISLTCIMIFPMVLKLQRMVSLHGTEHPHSTHDIPPAS